MSDINDSIGQIINGTFNKSDLTDTTGADVQLRIEGTPETVGVLSTRGSIEVGAVEWNAVLETTVDTASFTLVTNLSLIEGKLT